MILGLNKNLFMHSNTNSRDTGLQEKTFRSLAGLTVMLFLTACQPNSKNWQHNQDFLPESNQTESNQTESNQAQSAVQSQNSDNAGSGNALTNDTSVEPGQQIIAGEAIRVKRPKAPSSSSKPNSNGGDIMLRFSQTPIRDVAQIILGDYLEKEFEVDDAVNGSVSLNNQSGLNKADLLPTLETLLSSVDAKLVEEGGAFKIVPGAKKQVSFSNQNLDILPLRYIKASEFAKMLGSYQVGATVIEDGNLLALSGPQSKINQVRKLAKSFDVNWLAGKSIGLFPVRNASVQTIKGELLELFGNGIDRELEGALRLIAIERSNTIMVIASQRDSVSLMGEWVNRLDRVGGEDSQNFFIYRVQNGRAADLAELLTSMFGQPRRANGSLDDIDQDRGRADNQGPGSSSQNQSRRNNTNGDFRVIADESTNSLIVSGSPHYFKLVRQAMEQLDSTPLQVLVEARIMELTLTDDLQYGLEWFLNGSRASSNTSSNLDFRVAGVDIPVPGFSYVIERAGEVRAALNGLADDSRLKVLSSPSLMVLNNQTASILVGDEVPIPTRQAISNISPDAPTVNEIEYRNTGILLTVSPRVNSGGMVTMDISQEVSSVANNTTSQIDAPTIQQRKLNSTVSIRSGQTVVLGGLIREQDSVRDSGVPLLKNIPGFGKLFSNTSNRVQRTELVVLITPRVILNEQDTDSITEEYQRKMIGLRPIRVGEM